MLNIWNWCRSRNPQMHFNISLTIKPSRWLQVTVLKRLLWILIQQKTTWGVNQNAKWCRLTHNLSTMSEKVWRRHDWFRLAVYIIKQIRTHDWWDCSCCNFENKRSLRILGGKCRGESMATCQNRAENQTDITGYYDRGPGRGLK